MNAKFKNSLVSLSFCLMTAPILGGCGGSGVPIDLSAKFASSYTVQVVEAPAGASSIEFRCISPNGNIGGRYNIVGDKSVVFSYSNGVRTDQTPVDEHYFPNSIMDDGTIDGNFVNAGADWPFSTIGGSYHDITPAGSYTDGQNCGRDLAGRSYLSMTTTDGSTVALREQNGNYTPLTVPSASSVSILAKSPGGYAAGSCRINSVAHSVLFTPGSNVGKVGKVFASTFSIVGINDSGNFVGSNKVGNEHVAFVNLGGSHKNVGGLGGNYSSLTGINNENLAVGAANQLGNGAYRATGWSNSEGLFDLNSRITGLPGFIATYAAGMDNSGRIVGYGYYQNKTVAYILTPDTV